MAASDDKRSGDAQRFKSLTLPHRRFVVDDDGASSSPTAAPSGVAEKKTRRPKLGVFQQLFAKHRSSDAKRAPGDVDRTENPANATVSSPCDAVRCSDVTGSSESSCCLDERASSRPHAADVVPNAAEMSVCCDGPTAQETVADHHGPARRVVAPGGCARLHSTVKPSPPPKPRMFRRRSIDEVMAVVHQHAAATGPPDPFHEVRPEFQAPFSKPPRRHRPTAVASDSVDDDGVETKAEPAEPQSPTTKTQQSEANIEIVRNETESGSKTTLTNGNTNGRMQVGGRVKPAILKPKPKLAMRLVDIEIDCSGTSNGKAETETYA